ncbi:ogr/Delta-like zinc finger family protein [uncultured Microbulbifer sp.]|uniref:ogr/Delta-like zinc finger family protein n=1 Tax=uncultured Microbulbifer sp. TaxID=348147 RepID=UPI00344E1796
MMIHCIKCESRAIITSSNRMDPKLTQLYCACKNQDCGHTFVCDLGFCRTISPPKNDKHTLLKNLLMSLPTKDRLALFESINKH